MGRPKNSVERMLVVDVDTSGDCWNWKGAVAENGYSKTAIGRRSYLPHRLFYEHFKGAIPDGFEVVHSCRNRRCVNPAHLGAVAGEERNLRGTSPTAVNAAKASCVREHSLTGTNLYITPNGRRQCRTCRRSASRKHSLGA